jgi:hypothetical protein
VSVPPMGSSWAWEVESVAILAPARGDAEGFIHKVALHEGQLVEAHRSRDEARERVHRLLNSTVEGARRLMASERSVESSLGSFPFCGLGASSCAFPSSAHRK